MERVIPRLPIDERLFWASRTFTPEEDLCLLAKDRSKAVRRALAENPACPREALFRLSKDKDEYVRVGLKENPKAPPELLEELYGSSENRKGWFLCHLARDPSTPAHTLRELAEKYWQLRVYVAENPGAPPELLRELLEKDPSLDYYVAGNPATPLDILLWLMRQRRLTLRIAGNPSLPGEYLRELAKHEDKEVREKVGRNPNAPRDVLEALAKDKDPEVRRAVAGNPATPPELLAQLAKDAYMEWAVAGNPSCPLEVLQEMDWGIALRNPNLTLEGFAQLIIANAKRRGWLGKDEALKLLPLLDFLPKEPRLWLEIWKSLDERERSIFEEHPDARGMLLLARLGS